MQGISSDDMLTHLENLLDIEKTMIETYGEFVEKLEDEKIQETLKHLANAEKAHYHLVVEAQEIVKNIS